MEWIAYLEHIRYHHWLLLAIILIILEIFAPGAFLLWLGIAAGLVSLIVFLLPGLTWGQQFLLFTVFSIASLFIWYTRLIKHPTPTDQPMLNRRGEQYIGRIFTLDEPIINNIGKIKVDDSTWKISGKDCDADLKVKIIAVDGVILKVELV